MSDLRPDAQKAETLWNRLFRELAVRWSAGLRRLQGRVKAIKDGVLDYWQWRGELGPQAVCASRCHRLLRRVWRFPPPAPPAAAGQHTQPPQSLPASTRDARSWRLRAKVLRHRFRQWRQARELYAFARVMQRHAYQMEESRKLAEQVGRKAEVVRCLTGPLACQRLLAEREQQASTLGEEIRWLEVYAAQLDSLLRQGEEQ